MAPPTNQDAILQQFKEELTNDDLLHDGDSIGTDDRTLLRFLVARQFNLKQAKTMWKNCYEWRKTAEGVGIDELYRQIDPFDYPERDHVFKFWPLFFHKTDKKGRPLNIHHFGRINTVELYKRITPERFWQAFLVNADSLTREVLPAAANAAGRPIEGTLVVVDLKGFGTGQFWQMKHLARGAFQVSQDYFPETMAHLAIVNAPSSFTLIWAAMKPWLARETVAKVSVLGVNYRKALLELVDAENLPASLGGTCTCEDCGSGSDGCDDADKAGEEGKVGVDEMGRCAFSSAGPWMVGRQQRREAWLRGERASIALQPGELEKFSQAESGASSQAAPQTQPIAIGTVEEDGEGDSSENSSPGPGTPGADSSEREPALEDISIRDDAKSVASTSLSRDAIDVGLVPKPEAKQPHNVVRGEEAYVDAEALAA